MINTGVILFFIFIFSLLTIIRTIFKFFISLLQDPPEKMNLDQKSLIFYGVCLSYIITYIIKI
jgi:hypothetical protein